MFRKSINCALITDCCPRSLVIFTVELIVQIINKIVIIQLTIFDFFYCMQFYISAPLLYYREDSVTVLRGYTWTRRICKLVVTVNRSYQSFRPAGERPCKSCPNKPSLQFNSHLKRAVRRPGFEPTNLGTNLMTHDDALNHCATMPKRYHS